MFIYINKIKNWLVEMLSFMAGGSLFLLMILWSLGGFVGAIYWAKNDNLLNVVLSIFIPLYGIISTLIDLL